MTIGLGQKKDSNTRLSHFPWCDTIFQRFFRVSTPSTIIVIVTMKLIMIIITLIKRCKPERPWRR